jgi:hypothetical protein
MEPHAIVVNWYKQRNKEGEMAATSKGQSNREKGNQIFETWSDTWGQALLLYPPRSP